MWENYAFGLELALHERLLASPHRTLNPEDADFFFLRMPHTASNPSLAPARPPS